MAQGNKNSDEMIRVRTRKFGRRRRAGRAFTREPVTLVLAELSQDELKAIKSDKLLLVEEVEGSGNGGSTSGDNAITMEVFQGAVSQLDQKNKKHWMKCGAPELKALNAVGLKLSAKERDELWKAYKDSEVEGYWVRAKEGVVKLEGFDCDFDTDGVGFALDAITDEQLKVLEADEALIVERGTFGGLVEE